MTEPLNTQQLLLRIFFLFVLVFALLIVLTWTNTMKCGVIGDDWCNLYYTLKGQPKVLIVYGDDGLGDPFDLQMQFFDRVRGLGIRPDLLYLERSALGNLKPYELVIVTRARAMSTEHMRMFIDYAIQGGKLIWTGDAGTALPLQTIPGTYVDSADLNESIESNFLHLNEVKGSDTNSRALVGPWARKLDGKVVRLDELLAVQYQERYCNLKPCVFDTRIQPISNTIVNNIPVQPTTQQPEMCPAVMNAVNTDNRFVYALRSNLPFCFIPPNDFAIVQLIPGKTATAVLTVDFAGPLVVQNKVYGRSLPLIVSAAKSSLFGHNIGENTAYYALPLEYYSYALLPVEHQYSRMLVNAYKAMMFG